MKLKWMFARSNVLATHSVSPMRIEELATALKSKGQISYTNANMVELQLDPQKAALALIHMRNAIVGMKTGPHSTERIPCSTSPIPDRLSAGPV